jgi:heme exporter protein A
LRPAIVCCIKFRFIESFKEHCHTENHAARGRTHEFSRGTWQSQRAVTAKMRLLGRGVRCVRGGREVFSSLDFEASAGRALAVTGRNGSGKTSLLRLIGGLLIPAGGSIVLEGGDAELTLGEQAHYLGHRDALKPALSVAENLAFWRDFLGGETSSRDFKAAESLKDRLGQNLAAVGLDHAAHLPAAYLSAGQRRRLSLARLIAIRRPLWLLDEPTAALDAAGQGLFADLMRDHLAGEGIIVAATHGPLGVEAQELRIGDAG